MTNQHPPFMICVPFVAGPDWPGVVVGKVEALLDGLGDPAMRKLKTALDATGVIHFLSVAVVWDETSGGPPFLVVHVAGDGTPGEIIAALVKHAGALLMPVFDAVAGVKSTNRLAALLKQNWVNPVGAAWPAGPRRLLHRATGLPFQGTPGLTVAGILDDERIAKKARSVVFHPRPQAASAALSRLRAARAALSITAPKGRPFALSDGEPPLARAGLFAQAAAIFGLIAIDWFFLPAFLIAIFALNFSDVVHPLANKTTNNTQIFGYLILSSVGLSIFVHIATRLFKDHIFGFVQSRSWLPFIVLILLLSGSLAAIFIAPGQVYDLLPGWLDRVVRAISQVGRWVTIAWIAFALSVVAVALFVAVVAAIFVWVLRWDETHLRKPCDADPGPRFLAEITRTEDLPPHKQNHMIGVATIPRGLLGLPVSVFRRFVCLPLGLYGVGLLVRAGLFRKGYLSRVGSIHFAQWVCVPGTNKLVFVADYDGSWQSYLEDFITLSPQGATAIWSNTVGFPKTRLLFLDGAADGDRFKRWVRRQMSPTHFWYSAYPHLTAADIRRNADIRCGLEARSMSASDAETWLGLFGSAPRPASDMETNNIQGLAIRDYRDLAEGVVLAFQFPANRAKCRTWLSGVLKGVDFGDAGQREDAMAVALSAQGLTRLRLGAGIPLAADFSPVFANGMETRSNVLGDMGGNAPGTWQWGGPGAPIDAVLVIYAKDQPTLLARVAAETARCGVGGPTLKTTIRLRHQAPASQPIKVAFGFVDGISQPAIRGLASARGALANDLLEPGEFILGYPDGRERFAPTPQVLSANDPRARLPDLPDGFPRPDSAPPVRDLGRNGSYLVIRQLEQDAAMYENYIRQAAVSLHKTPKWVAAKMVGRWPNGAPLVMFPDAEPATYTPSPKTESFLFGRDDPQGLACPFGAHIRRANPRDHFDAGDPRQISITNRHRIIRRGRSYVSGADSTVDPQGLVFMCLNADIERQFEFLQQTWIGSTFFGDLRDESDPIAAMDRKRGSFTIPTPEGPERLTGLPSFVKMIGGGYFFLPGRQALEFLSS